MPGLGHASSFSVLVVCTANRVRSPLAEFLLRQAADRAALPWTVSSAGTAAVLGEPADPHVSTLLAKQGADLSDWRSRPVDAAMLADADLVLVMTSSHRSELSRLAPASLPKTFLLLDFAARSADFDRGGVPVADVGARLVDHVRRAARQPTGPPLDVADPVGRSRWAYRRTARLLRVAAQTIAGGAPGARGQGKV